MAHLDHRAAIAVANAHLAALRTERETLDHLQALLEQLTDRRDVMARRRAEVAELVARAFPDGLGGE